jgi:hypothetical protein
MVTKAMYALALAMFIIATALNAWNGRIFYAIGTGIISALLPIAFIALETNKFRNKNGA